MEGQAKGVDGIELKRTRLDEARFLLAIEDPKAANGADATKLWNQDVVLAASSARASKPIVLNSLSSKTQCIGGAPLKGVPIRFDFKRRKTLCGIAARWWRRLRRKEP